MPDAPDVLFVVLDSTRTDRVSAYGHVRETTPALDELAASATVYENAFTPAPWTLPSHCSMFTGRHPSEHGITNGFTDRNLHLSEDIPTVTERLAERGYRTAGFSNNPWVGQLSGLDRGFDRYVEWDLEISRTGDRVPTRHRDEVFSRLHAFLGRAAGQPHALLKRRFFTGNLVDRADRWLAANSGAATFTFLNLMEAHSPYYPPREAFRQLGLEVPGAIEPRTLNARLLAYVLGKVELSDSMRERVLEFYDASLRFQDGQLRRLLDRLRSSGQFDDALIVVCSDHGKTLGEYDRNGTPPHYVRDVNVNVPLVVKWPGQRSSERVERPVELVDIFDAIRASGDRDALETHETGALVEDHVPHTGREAEEVVQWRIFADENRKYVRNDGGAEYLFDRGLEEGVSATNDALLDPYRSRLADRVAHLEEASATQGETDDGVGRTVEGQLEDLGYLG